MQGTVTFTVTFPSLLLESLLLSLVSYCQCLQWCVLVHVCVCVGRGGQLNHYLLNLSTTSPEKPEPLTCCLQVAAGSSAMPFSALWVWDAAGRCKGHNSKMYSNRRVVATLSDTEEGFRKPLEKEPRDCLSPV